MTLTTPMQRALAALARRPRIVWETGNPVHDESITISRQSLDALVRRNLARVDVTVHRVSGQRIATRWGRSWRDGYCHVTRIYTLLTKGNDR